jgi:hypothetical protein
MINFFGCWNRKRLIILGLILPVILSLACNISLGPEDNGATAEDLSATQMALQATQVALEIQQQQPPQDPQPPQQQDPQQPPPQDPQPPEAPDVSFQGVSFSYDKSLAGGVTSEIVPKDDSEMEPAPHHMMFKFSNYINQGTFHESAIRIYPVSEFTAMEPYVVQIVTQLQAYLGNKNVNPPPDQDMPFLPMWNAAQMITTQVQYLEFQNGSCVRYLSQYGQAANPINNESLFYTAQCLTSDNQHYISAVLPVSHPQLPANGNDVPGGDWAAFSENFPDHVEQMKQLLGSQPANSYKPNLELLDAMMRTFLVEIQGVG